jgi:Tol biopolymer transport system component
VAPIRDRQFLLIAFALALLLVCLMGVVLVIGAGPASRSQGQIAFVQATYDSGSAIGPRILTVASSGGAPTQVAAVPGDDHRVKDALFGPIVRWSPDGTRLAFRLFNDAPGIYVMNRDGTGLRRVFEPAFAENPGVGIGAGLEWSPDGARIAFAFPFVGRLAPLHVVDVDSGLTAKLSVAAAVRGRRDVEVSRVAKWSPDGTMIAFARAENARNNRSAIYVLSTDGTGERLLAGRLDGQITGIAWSPDGTRIAFAREGSDRDPGSHVQAINVDGSAETDLATLPPEGCCRLRAIVKPMKWSPDGSVIAVAHSSVGPGNPHEAILLVDAFGQGIRELVAGNQFDWSPDGSQLVVSDAGTEGVGRPYSIVVVNVDGTDVRHLAEGEFPAWAPAGPGTSP